MLAGILLLLLAYLALAPTPWDVSLVPGGDDWRKVSARRWALAGSWYAAAVNVGIVGLLLVTRRHWIGGEAPGATSLPAPSIGPGPWRTGAVLLAMVALAALAFTRLDASFWDDEVYTVERAVSGRYGDGPDGELRFKPASWAETFFYYRTPNNHVPYSVVARLGLEAWRGVTGAERRVVSEAVVRAPAWLAALATLGTVAIALWLLGFVGAVPVAAAVLVLHPWMLRYASEARGYAFLMLLITVGISLLLCVWKRGTWPRWAAFGASQLLLMWTFPGAAWHAMGASAAAAAGVFLLHPRGEARRTQLWRWLATHLGAAGVGVQLGLPLIGQLFAYLGEADTQRPVTGRWLRDEAGYLFAGTPWRQPNGLGPDFPQLAPLAAEHPVIFWSTALAASVAVVAGAIRLGRLRDPRALLLPLLLAPGILTWLQAWVTGSYLFEWYLLFTVPGLVMLGAIGGDALAGTGGRSRRGLAAGLALAFLLAFTFVTEPARSRLRAGSLQPLRESARIGRPEENPFAPGQEAILTASHTVPSRLYDPHVQLLRHASELRALMEEADASGKALYVDHGWHMARKKDGGAFWKLLQQGDAFEEVAVIPGWKPRLTRFVWRYRGGGAEVGAPGDAARPADSRPSPP